MQYGLIIIKYVMMYLVLVVKARHIHNHCNNVSLCKSNVCFCKDATNKQQTIDTQKPLVQQYEQAFERTKAAVTPSQYDIVLQMLQFKWKNATSSCASMSVIFKGAQLQCDQIYSVVSIIFKGAQLQCDQIYSVVSIICNTPTAKSQMVLCIDPFVNEYLKSRNITGTNIERFARYYLD